MGVCTFIYEHTVYVTLGAQVQVSYGPTYIHICVIAKERRMLKMRRQTIGRKPQEGN